MPKFWTLSRYARVSPLRGKGGAPKSLCAARSSCQKRDVLASLPNRVRGSGQPPGRAARALLLPPGRSSGPRASIDRSRERQQVGAPLLLLLLICAGCSSSTWGGAWAWLVVLGRCARTPSLISVR